MTSKQFRALSPEQQRITVAELAGWKDNGRTWVLKYTAPGGETSTLQAWNLDELPDFLHDLNAMHGIGRRCLTTANLQARYIRELKELAWDEAWTKADGWACFATAANGLVLLSWR